MKTSSAVSFVAFVSTVLAATSGEWRSRSIYQVLTDRYARTDGSIDAPCNTGDRKYCGGTFKGIENHLDYIQDMGFDAVWISPVTAQIDEVTEYGEAYHGYWQQDIFSINSHFGTEDDLKSLSDALHDRGMYLMLDVVVNHFASNGGPDAVNYSSFRPFNDSSDYHSYCPINFDDISNTDQLEQCWMGDTTVSLPDVRTEDPEIAGQWNDWIADMVSTYSLDGLRLDSAIEVNPSFWPDFADASGVYFVGETYNGDVDFVCSYQSAGIPGIMDYPTYYALLSAFTSTPPTDDSTMDNLALAINTLKSSSCPDISLKGTFTENHDRPRIAHVNGDLSAAKNALAYTILTDGIPIVYQGQEQHYSSLGGEEDPYNREALWLSGYNTSAPLYELVGKLNAARKAAITDPDVDGEGDGYLTYRTYPIYTDTTTIALRKGKMIVVLSNKGSEGDVYEQVIPTQGQGLESGLEMTEVLSCENVVVNGGGGIRVPMEAGEPRVYFPSEALGGSGLCRSGSVGGAAESTSGSGEAKRSARWHHLRRHLQ